MVRTGVGRHRTDRAPFFLSTSTSTSTSTLLSPSLRQDALLSRVLPPKADITLLKLSNRASAYSVAGVPLLFELDRSPALLPTVHGLWLAGPDARLLPSIFTHSEVSPKVLGGADLFLQGFIVPEDGGLPPLAAGDVAIVRVLDPQADPASAAHQHAFAVGVMECSSEEAAASGFKGKGLRLLHHYPDGLWALSEAGVKVPGPEFTPGRVFVADGWNGNEVPTVAAPTPKADKPPKTPREAKPPQSVPAGEDSGAGAGLAALDLNSDGPDANASTSAAATPAASTSPAAGLDYDTPAGQDALALHCLLAALMATPDTALPCLTSDIMARMSEAAAILGVRLDLKKSTFKQLAKLLKKYEKEKVLTTKLVRKQDSLASVERSHPLYLAAVAEAGSRAPAAAGAAGAPPTAPSPPSSAATAAPIKLSTAYRVGALLRPIFEAAHGAHLDKERLYTAPECEAALRAYAATHGLTTAAGGASADAADAISLDAFLAAGLFNKKEAVPTTALPAGDLADRLLARLTEHTLVRRTLPGGGVATAVKKGGPPKLTVSLEDRVGGRKHLTHISGGIEAFGLTASDLATVLQKRFKTSASVSRPGPDVSSVALQGDLMDGVLQFLKNEYGLGERHVEVKGGGR